MKWKYTKYSLICIFLHSVIYPGVQCVTASEEILATLTVSEKYGYSRNVEYVDYLFQIPITPQEISDFSLIAVDQASNEEIVCQILEREKFENEMIALLRIIFPVALEANQKKIFQIMASVSNDAVESDLTVKGNGFDLIIENNFYKADLSKNTDIEPQSHNSGQLRDLLIKMGFNQLLTNAEDRLHWAPNFKRPELEWYTTIAHWNSPTEYEVWKGPYLIQTYRRDSAPDHPEILLTATYKFYQDLPYFRFFSEMELVQNVWLELLRNDEMTMDSMFTHLAFQRPDGKIEDVTFSDRGALLEDQPIENESPWICFYNSELKFAFASIRLRYDNSNMTGQQSPTYLPHTQIGEWLGGIKYWNRRLIHEHLTFVPKGSRYSEENAYLVFKIGEEDKFKDIIYWMDRLHHPLEIKVKY
jgi:hypothetical protein